jgi:uncharacterized protein YyaL (SSP411 family)
MIPHFEKMLYDNGQLLRLYAHAASATGETLFRDTALRTAHWIMREMESPTGGYWSSMDADSEGHEGRFYVWDKKEVQQHLSPEEFAIFAARFGLDQPANFEGKWHLHAHHSVEELAKRMGLDLETTQGHLAQAERKLLEARNARARPGRDEKILTSWNALAISGMASAARLLGDPSCSRSALKAIDLIHEHLFPGERLLAVFKDARARFPAYLDDYAFLLQALLEVLQMHWRTRDLRFAILLAQTLLDHFEDKLHGGFFFTADDHETLIHRSKSFADEALPAGNAIAAQALTRLGLLLGDTGYLDAAARTLRAAGGTLEQHPQAHASMLIALDEHLNPPEIVIIRGEEDELAHWQATIEAL